MELIILSLIKKSPRINQSELSQQFAISLQSITSPVGGMALAVMAR
ncbi:MAG: winged helix-turn-helix transcriptional regulator [Sphaerochaeta sp.]